MFIPPSSARPNCSDLSSIMMDARDNNKHAVVQNKPTSELDIGTW
jgi:hypothetical protein